VLIRQEEPHDHDQVGGLHLRAFSSHGKAVARLVVALRESLKREPGLSLVAVDDDGTVAGHVLFSRNLLDAPRRIVEVQVLSPLGVLPSRQRSGIGTALVRGGLDILDQRKTPLVFLEGSPEYYPRFGFEPARKLGFRRPSLRIPVEAFQVRLLRAYEPWMNGTLVYREAFWDHDAVGRRESEQ
jgi:putative acetyltransferase